MHKFRGLEIISIINFLFIHKLQMKISTVRAGDLGHEGDLGHLDKFFSFNLFSYLAVNCVLY
jgi:hypothetical protein